MEKIFSLFMLGVIISLRCEALKIGGIEITNLFPHTKTIQRRRDLQYLDKEKRSLSYCCEKWTGRIHLKIEQDLAGRADNFILTTELITPDDQIIYNKEYNALFDEKVPRLSSTRDFTEIDTPYDPSFPPIVYRTSSLTGFTSLTQLYLKNKGILPTGDIILKTPLLMAKSVYVAPYGIRPRLDILPEGIDDPLIECITCIGYTGPSTAYQFSLRGFIDFKNDQADMLFQGVNQLLITFSPRAFPVTPKPLPSMQVPLGYPFTAPDLIMSAYQMPLSSPSHDADMIMTASPSVSLDFPVSAIAKVGPLPPQTALKPVAKNTLAEHNEPITQARKNKKRKKEIERVTKK